MLIPFVDILYGLAIGTGFASFPKDPLSDAFGTAVFIYTLFIAAQDWYEYHDKADLIRQNHRLTYAILQIFVVLVINQMFVHSVSSSLVPWLVYAGIFCVLNVIWNIITPFRNHLLYATTSGILALTALFFSVIYQNLLNYVTVVDGRWLMLVLAVLIPMGINCAEKRIDR